MKPWNELTEAEVDALGGDELAGYVAEARGIAGKWLEPPESFVPYYTLQDVTREEPCYTGIVGLITDYALEVWQALVALDTGYTLEMDFEDAGVYHSGRDELLVASGTFCEAICRAYLKERLADVRGD